MRAFCSSTFCKCSNLACATSGVSCGTPLAKTTGEEIGKARAAINCGTTNPLGAVLPYE